MNPICKYASQMLSTMLFAIVLPLFTANMTQACTGIDFSIQDLMGNSHAFAGRTMEFGPDVAGWKLLYVPKEYHYHSCKLANRIDTCVRCTAVAEDGTCADKDLENVQGYTWQTRHAYVGFTPIRHIVFKLDFVLNELTDGINDAGLYCGGFYHMRTEEYSNSKVITDQKNISSMDFPSWVLGRFSNVAEVKEALTNPLNPDYAHVRQFSIELAPGVPVTKESKFPQLHFKVVDKTGAAIVVEFVNGKAKIFDSVGVITNNPTYDWQVTNLRNFVGLQAKNHESVTYMGKPYNMISNGTGAIGLPGDFTSPSRFIRAMFLLNSTLTYNKVHTPEEAILRSFRILNQFDIPEGSVVETKENHPKKITTMEATSWTSMADLTHLLYYYNTMNSRVIRMINLRELMKQHPAAPGPLMIDVPKNETIINVTDNFKDKL